MTEKQFNKELLAFLTASPTPFHAVANMSDTFRNNGFQELMEADRWDPSPGRYFVVRNQSSIIAFVIGSTNMAESGIRLVGAHTDSPCLKVKPKPEKSNQSYRQLGVEVYGGVLLNPWFDRDLSIAGRVTVRTSSGDIENHLVNLEAPVAIIPSLAIHLDRDANNSRKINAETDIPPVLMQGDGEFKLANLLDETIGSADLLASELSFYDSNPPQIIGLNNEFLASARLDNLLSCFTGMQALLDADSEVTSLLVCNDHEEVGSSSAAGADGTFLLDVLSRIAPEGEDRLRTFSRSLLVSTDNAHGIHPNYPSKHESNHGPVLNQGPAIKYNANQRYATNSETAGYFKHLCEQSDVPCQEFVNRADMACGSTIGPITASAIGVKTLDVGVPTFAMHSIRELAGVADAHNLCKVLTRFYQDKGPLGASAEGSLGAGAEGSLGADAEG